MLKSVLQSSLFLGVLTVLTAPAATFAATLNAVPMQGGMVMPMISYHSEHGHLHVTMDPAVPQLTPLAVSNPGDSFNSTDPWFEALDPAREGRSFSRRYGFVMDSMTELLPAGTAIWIRMLSSSPGLSAYRYSNTEPKTFEPIFGTDGTTNAMFWNGMMFHPIFSAPQGSGPLTATFEAFLVNSTTGEAVPNSSTGPFVLNWTNITDGRPELKIEQRVVIPWPASATNYVLESATSVPDGVWSVVTNQPVMIDGQQAIVLEKSEQRRMFRMRLAQ